MADAALTTNGTSDNFRPLFESVEDLIKRVADLESSDIQKIRAKVRIALIAAKSAVDDGAERLRSQAAQVAVSTDHYVRIYPWQTVGVAAVVGVALGLLARPKSAQLGS